MIMKKKEMIKRIREINARFKGLADTCVAEKRNLTPEEVEEKNAIETEKNI